MTSETKRADAMQTAPSTDVQTVVESWGHISAGRGPLLALLVLAVLAGCAAPMGDTPPPVEGGIGEVDGVTYNETFGFEDEEQLNESQREMLLKRSMARVEVVRDLEFEHQVEFDVISRETYRTDYRSRPGETHAEWNNQVWKGLFLVGDDRDVVDVFDEAFGGAVAGFYQVGQHRIVVVTDEEEPVIRKSTLVHELTHALQDQHFGLDGRPDRQDPQLAQSAVVEGEAEVVPSLYLERCGAEWTCYNPSVAPGATGNLDWGVLNVVLYPYRVGPEFVEEIRADGGWAAVDDLHTHYPSSTAQVTHPERYPDRPPLAVSVPDRAGADWERFDHDPVGDTIGEASIFVMLSQNDVIEPADPRSYEHPVTTGWRGDELAPYRSSEGDSFGYVWKLEWESDEDAGAFADAYRELLDGEGATSVGEDTYVVDEDSNFGHAYRVTQEGTRVTIVNAPSEEALSDIHARR